MDDKKPRTLTIAVPTFRRNQMLAHLLTALDSEIHDLASKHPTVTSSILVVDNDPSGGAREVTDGRPGTRYVLETDPGIAAVRNRALDESIDIDLLVFIDDDEVPRSGWLAELVGHKLHTDADAVAGRVITDLDGLNDPWILASGAFVRPVRDDLSEIAECATNNLLLDLRSIRTRGLSFDARFGLSGGSDSLFSRALTRAGGRIVWANEAVVIEQEAPERMTRSWVLARTYRFGNTSARVNIALASTRIERTVARVSSLCKGLLRVLAGGAGAAIGIITRNLRRRARSERTMARGRGMMAGAFGKVYNEYGLRRATPESAASPIPAKDAQLRG